MEFPTTGNVENLVLKLLSLFHNFLKLQCLLLLVFGQVSRHQKTKGSRHINREKNSFVAWVIFILVVTVL